MDGAGAEPREAAGNRPAPLPLDEGPLREQLSLGELLAVMRRRRTVILATILVLTAIATILVLRLTPYYTAEATVLLDTRKTDVVDLKSVISSLQPEAMTVRSEIDVLRSRELAAKVIDKLGLQGDPVFTKGIVVPPHAGGMLSSWREAAERFLMSIGLERPPQAPAIAAAEEQEQIRTKLVDRLIDQLSVGTDGKSYTIHLAYDSPSPVLAARILNTLAETYLVDQLDAKFDATKRANAWLSERLGGLKQEVESAEAAVAQFRQDHHLNMSDMKGTTVTTQQLGELNSQLVLASADLAQKQAQLSEFQNAIKHGQGAAAAASVLQSPLINELRQQEAEVLRKEAELSSRFGDRYPPLIQVRQELHDLRDNIANEVGKVTGSLGQDVAVARGRVDSIRGSLDQLTHASGVDNDAMVKLNELQREAEADRTLYENFLNRFKETSNEADLQQPDARIIGAAVEPTSPSFPQKKLFVLLALIGSSLVGVAAALTLEWLDDGFRSPAQIERLTGLPGLGMVPTISGLARLGYAAEEHLLRKPTSNFAESIRSIRTAVLYSHVDRPPKVLLITSAVPEEGKSMLALSIARTAAQGGQKVLLVDCDLRRPSLTRYLLGKRTAPTLADLFAGVSGPEAVRHLDEGSGLEFIGAKTGMPNPQDLLGSQHMREFLRSAGQHYDLVVLDSPPVMAASDGQVLARQVDATIFVVRWEKTPRAVVLNAIRQIQAVGGRVAGIVLSRVVLHKHRRFNFGDQGYYYGTYEEYRAT